MFPSVFRICLLVSVILNALAQGHGHHHDHEDGEGISDDDNIWSRYRRALAYPYNSCTGVLIAIAVPLNLPHHNVFVSYNFEANYNMPTAATDISPGVFQRLQLAGVTDPSLEPEEPVADARRDRRSVAEAGLLTRAKFYRYLIRKMNGHQWNGKACLLRLICEAAANPTDEHNGVLGSLLQVVLTPSSSDGEAAIHDEYYRAEKRGRTGLDNCTAYQQLCPQDPFDVFTQFDND